MGRRTTHLFCIVTGFVGCSLSLVFNFYCLIAGRLIFGFASGTLSVASPRMVEEYVPVHLQSTFIPVYITAMAFGSSFALFSAALLPPDSDSEALQSSQVYLYIMGFPLVLYILMAVLLFTVIKYETPKFYMVAGEKKTSLKVIKKIYYADSMHPFDCQA